MFGWVKKLFGVKSQTAATSMKHGAIKAAILDEIRANPGARNVDIAYKVGCQPAYVSVVRQRKEAARRAKQSATLKAKFASDDAYRTGLLARASYARSVRAAKRNGHLDA